VSGNLNLSFPIEKCCERHSAIGINQPVDAATERRAAENQHQQHVLEMTALARLGV